MDDEYTLNYGPDPDETGYDEGLSEETKELIADGTIEPEDGEDFENLDSDLQELVESGDIDMDEVRDL